MRPFLLSAERIDPRDPADLRFWAASLDVAPHELRATIDRVGTLRAAVERELRWRRASTAAGGCSR